MTNASLTFHIFNIDARLKRGCSFLDYFVITHYPFLIERRPKTSAQHLSPCVSLGNTVISHLGHYICSYKVVPERGRWFL